MKFFKPLIISLLGFFLVVLPVLAQDFPQPVGYVNDFAVMLSSDFRDSLEEDLTQFEEETKAEIAVVTVNSLEGTYVEDYAVRLFEQWGIGKKEADNGLLLLIAKEDREFKIEVGYGLEPIITDGRAGKILREQMIPSFKEGNYDQGVKLAVEKIEEYIRSGEPPLAETEELPKRAPPFTLFFISIFLIFIYTSAFLARSKSYYAGGVLGGILGSILGFLIGSLATIIFTALGLGIFGLILDYILSKNYKELKGKKKKTGFFSSWGGFSSGGGGGGFGGFSGGSSGGGGASGGW